MHESLPIHFVTLVLLCSLNLTRCAYQSSLKFSSREWQANATLLEAAAIGDLQASSPSRRACPSKANSLIALSRLTTLPWSSFIRQHLIWMIDSLPMIAAWVVV
eukprot:6385646-Amphidinium_carterae.1